MAIKECVRVTGRAVRQDEESYESKGVRRLRRTIRVMVGDGDLCEVSVPDGKPSPWQGPGDVDWQVSVSVFYERLRIEFEGPWGSTDQGVGTPSLPGVV